jgi:hypothetical protein
LSRKSGTCFKAASNIGEVSYSSPPSHLILNNQLLVSNFE